MTRPQRIALLVMASAFLVLIHWLLARSVEPIGVASYFATAGVLQFFKRVGMPVLRGSPDGWPMPTELGLVLSAAAWFLVYLAVLMAIYALTAQSTRTRA